MKIIDTRGFACPHPVLLVKKACEESNGGQLRVLYDEGPSKENIMRFCHSRSYALSEAVSEGGVAALTITTGTGVLSPDSSKQLILIISSNRFGSGDDDLGSLLMRNFIITLHESANIPERIYFINSGVLLTTEGSESVEPLNRLANAGAELFSCGVCLDYYGLRDKLAAGEVTTMFAIVESLTSAAKTIII